MKQLLRYAYFFAGFAILVGCSGENSAETLTSTEDASVDAQLQEASTDAPLPDDKSETVMDQHTDAVQTDSTPDQSLSDSSIEASQADASNEADATTVTSFGILSLNLHCLKLDGTTFSDNQARFAAIADAVAKEDVHAIAVQEACEQNGVIAMDLLAQALKAATKDTWTTAWAFTHVAWQGTADQSNEGVGLLVRGQISDQIVLQYKVQGPLLRKTIGARLPSELGGFYLFSTHLDYSSAEARAAQGRDTAAALLTLTDPSLDLLVAGDFNANPTESPPLTMKSCGFTDLTASLDPTRIDYIFAHRGAALGLVQAKTVFDGTDYPVVSDHHGVIARIQPKAPIQVERTRLRIKADTSQWIAVRGSVAPLNWTEGFPAVQDADGWKLVLTEYAKGTSFEWKCLRQDATWEQGAGNHTSLGGDTTEITPSF